MMFDREKFWAGYRAAFGKATQKTVDAIEFLLHGFETNAAWKNIRECAYALATIKHETAGTFLPVTEIGGKSYFNKYNGRKDLGNTEQGDGYRFRGRGFVQITGRKNYAKYGIDDTPEAALEPATAFTILTTGMHAGMFTGKKLSDYITAKTADYRNARRIINGTDKADLIAGYARNFENILTNSVAASQAGGGSTVNNGQNSAGDPAGDPALQPPPTPPPPASLVPVQTPVIEVEQVTATKDDPVEPKKESWLDKLNSKAVALQGGILATIGSVIAWFTSMPWEMAAVLIGGAVQITTAAIITIALRNGGREKRRKDTEDKERELIREREQRAHEIQMLTLKAAMDPNLNAVRVVPPPVPLANSEVAPAEGGG